MGAAYDVLNDGALKEAPWPRPRDLAWGEPHELWVAARKPVKERAP